MKTYIFGKNASLSARSPKVFRYLACKLNIPLEMYPKDIKDKFDFINQLRELSIKDDFDGLLISNPWKMLWHHIEGNHPSVRVKNSNVSNLFWVDRYKRNRFENTDLIALRLILNKLDTNHVVVIGTGAMYKVIKLILKKKVKAISSKYNLKIKDKLIIHKDEKTKIDEIFRQSTLVINATPCGSTGFPGISLSAEHFRHLPKNSIVFDLVHTHSSKILKETCTNNSIRYIDGITMNNIQAVINFKIISSTIVDKSYSYLYSLISSKAI